MPKGYWIANMHVHDADAYEGYKRANAEPFARHGARFLVRGGEQRVAEGSMGSRTVVIEFPSYQAARDCYDDPAYQEAKALRDAPVSEGMLLIVEGYDPS
jgi:uncharacterized protein (DUF1330 family)